MKRNKDGSKHAHVMNSQDFPFLPTPPAQHMAETIEEFLVRIEYVGKRFDKACPNSNLGFVIGELKRLKKFCEEKTA